MPGFNLAYYMNIGLREEQEDCIFLNGRTVQERLAEGLPAAIEGGTLVYAVCDGMGGCERGELASRFVCDRLSEKLLGVDHPGGYIADVLKEIQWEFERDGVQGAGTTIAGVAIDDGGARVFNAGDSRVYKITERDIVCLSHDHSLVQEEIDRGLLSAEEAFTHPYRNLIGLGIGDVFRGEWADGRKQVVVVDDVLGDEEYYLLCTDGVNDVLRDGEIFDSLSPMPFAQLPGFFHRLAGRMKDNISLILIGKG